MVHNHSNARDRAVRRLILELPADAVANVSYLESADVGRSWSDDPADRAPVPVRAEWSVSIRAGAFVTFYRGESIEDVVERALAPFLASSKPGAPVASPADVAAMTLPPLSKPPKLAAPSTAELRAMERARHRGAG